MIEIKKTTYLNNKLLNKDKIYNILCIGFPIIIFAYMFLPYILFGENCVITIHDNLDSNIAWFKYVRDNNYFFKLNTQSTVMNGLSTMYFAGGFQLQNLVFYVFPPFVAYTLNFIFFTLIGFFGIYYLQKILFNNSYKLTNILVSIMFACLPCFPGFRMDVSAIPVAILLFYHIKNNTKKYLFLLPFFYPFISSFGGTELFICGFWLIGLIAISIKYKKINWKLLSAFLLLCIGTVFFNLRLFYMRLIVKEPLNRDFFVKTPIDIITSFKDYFFYGYYHAASLQKKYILPFTFFSLCSSFYIILEKFNFNIKESIKSISNELKVLIISLTLICFFSLIAALDASNILPRILNIICPVLKGFSFERFFMLNCVFWYFAFTSALILCYKEKMSKILAILCIGLQLILICSSKETYADTAKSWKKNTIGSRPTNITYKQFYSTDLFNEIKKDINYNGENVCALGFHPSVLMYNNFNCIDGYISVYPYKDMILWHNLLKPEFEHNEKDREYFDNWGGRRYIYNENLDTEPTIEKEHSPVKLDVDMDILANDFNCTYIISRAELIDYGKQGLKYLGSYTSNETIYKLFVYKILTFN